MRWIVIGALALFAFSANADQTRISNYDKARDSFVYPVVYAQGGRTLYCDSAFTDRSGLQVEHVLPASWMKEAGGCADRSRRQCRSESTRFNLMEADLHNLWPTLRDANQARSNYSFGVIGADTVDDFSGFCDFQVDRQDRLAEPRPEIRGDLARMVLYMVEEYGITLPDGQHDLMVAWHCEDNAPSAEERRRNNVIAAIQDTRNPYIDDPSRGCDANGFEDEDDYWEDCQIKGNINSRGDRIYHVPGSRSYNATKINTAKGERWFCTVKEAKDAGWRKPRGG